MGFPSERELKMIRKKLEKTEPSRLLPKNASKADHVKYKLCEMFVIYLTKKNLTQVQLAKKLKVDPSRINEIVKYRIDLYTVDKLMALAEKLDLDFEVRVAYMRKEYDLKKMKLKPNPYLNRLKKSVETS